MLKGFKEFIVRGNVIDLAVALVITPGAIAFLTVRSFGHMLIVSVTVCLTSLLAGAYLSFFLDSATAPTVVLILTAIFILAFGFRLQATRRRSQSRTPTLSRR